MLQNAYLLAKFRADTAENEQHFAEILPKIGNYPTGRLPCATLSAPVQVRAGAREVAGGSWIGQSRRGCSGRDGLETPDGHGREAAGRGTAI